MSTDLDVKSNNEINTKNCSDLEFDEEDEEKCEDEDVKDDDPRIDFMLKALPKLKDIFDIHYCIGSGTFSSVYLATLKSENHESFSERKKFAIKYLLPTSHPKRIEKELECLIRVGGGENVVKIHFCMRNLDSVVFVMPYLSHEKFSNYLMDMGPAETQLYLKNLLIAVRRVHKFNIIHRDVKPANFLYDRVNKKFLLVDMGLAHYVGDNTSAMPKLTPLSTNDNKRKRSSERENGPEESPTAITQPRKKITLNINKTDTKYDKIENNISKSPLKQLNCITKYSNNSIQTNNSSLSCNSRNRNSMFEYGSGNDLLIRPQNKASAVPSLLNKTSLRSSFISSIKPPAKTNIITAKRLDISVAPKPISKLETTSTQKQLANKIKAPDKPEPVSKVKYNTNARAKALNRKSLNALKSTIQSSSKNLDKSSTQCVCFGKSCICKICCAMKAIPAKREGTPGFRPPEVLLKYEAQTTAIDIWAVGIILLCILSRCYPFFDAPDDLTALAEIITLFGTDKIKHLAHSLGRSIVMSCEGEKEKNLKELCYILRNRQSYDNVDVAEEKSTLNQFPDSVYDLLTKLLDVNPFTRITAEDALNHDFFNENLVQ